MAVEQMFTQLPTVASATLSDIICAVQGYTSPSNPGLSVQETLQQVYNLFQSNVVLFNAGNPNGVVAGQTYQFCWDTVDNILWICTTTGTTSTAVWTSVSPATWMNVTTSTQTCTANTNYITNNGASLVTYTLPATIARGMAIRIAGFSAGGWRIQYNTGQSIIVGDASTTVTSGSLASTNQNDSIELLCTSANTTFTTLSGVGNFTIV